MALRMNPYFVLNGNARDAVVFYKQALGAEVLGMQTFGEMPPQPGFELPAELKDRVMHAHLKVGETDLMFSDTMPGMPYQVGNNVTVALHSPDADRSKQIFDALAEGGQVIMPLQQTFWSPAYGQVTDKFGVVWQVSTDPQA